MRALVSRHTQGPLYPQPRRSARDPRGVAVQVIQAVRNLPAERRPRHVYGCEVWGGLDWLRETDRVALDVSGHDHLAGALIGLYDSQISDGKRYDRATMGRRQANATYLASHAESRAEQVIFAMDLTPLARDADLDLSNM